MIITIHRGASQIGGSVVSVSAGNTKIALDAGNALETELPQDKMRLLQELQSCKDGIFLTHAHMDHSGLAAEVAGGIPIYSTVETSKMLMASSIFANKKRIPIQLEQPLTISGTIIVGDLSITTLKVDHSIAGSAAFLIEHEGRRLLYTGDIRMHGLDKSRWVQDLVRKASKPDALLIEGTNLSSGRSGEMETEEDLHRRMREVIGKAPGAVLAHLTPQNTDRLLGLYRACEDTGRTLVTDVYAAYILRLLRKQRRELPDPCKPNQRLKVWFNKSWLDKSARFKGIEQKINRPLRDNAIELREVLAAPHKYVAIYRPSMLELDYKRQLPQGVTLLYSMWSGYLERDPWQSSWASTKEAVNAAGGCITKLHTSGHIGIDDWKTLIMKLQPKSIIPIHTDMPAAYKWQAPNVRQTLDGEAIEIN